MKEVLINNLQKILIISCISVSSIILFFMILSYSSAYLFESLNKGPVDYQTNVINTNSGPIKYPYFSNMILDKKIKEIVRELDNLNVNIGHETVFIGYYVNIFFKMGDEYLSYLLSTKDASEQKIDVLFKKDTIHIFNALVQELLDNKYPKFISEAIKEGEGRISYDIKDDCIIVHFNDYDIKPLPQEDIYVRVFNSTIKDIYMYGKSYENIYGNDNIIMLEKNKKTVTLTFDDGPSGEITDRVIEVLNENKMKATFFMLGSRMKQYPELVKKAVNNGHEVGSHGYSHKYLTKIKQNTLDFEINETNRIYNEITGLDLLYLRPPYGKINEKIRKSINLPFILWSIDTRDWETRDALNIINSVLDDIQDGDIIIMHDNYITTLEALRVILPELYVRGFQVVTLSELISLKEKTVESHNVYKKFQ